MPLPFLTITITEPRIIDGWVEAANRNGTTPEAIAAEFLATQGNSYAELFHIGVITSAAFIRRFTAAEYGAILAAADENPEVAALVDQLTDSPTISMNDSRIEPALQQLAAAGLIAEDRIPVLMAYTRPEPALGE